MSDHHHNQPNKVSAFLDKVTGAANAVIDGTTITGAIITPVSVDALRPDFVTGNHHHHHSNTATTSTGGVTGASHGGNGLSSSSSSTGRPTVYSPMPWIVKGPYISIHQQPIRAFTAATALSIHGNARGADFDAAYKNAVESQRLINSAHNHLNTIVPREAAVVAAKRNSGLAEAASPTHPSSPTAALTTEGNGGSDDSTGGGKISSKSPFVTAHTSSVNGNLMKKASLLCENNGVCRSQISSNAIRCKKIAERGEEALAAAMTRGLLRRQNDAVGFLGRQQTVGDINDLDIAAVDREREEIAGVMASQVVQNEMAVEQYHRAHNAKNMKR